MPVPAVVYSFLTFIGTIYGLSSLSWLLSQFYSWSCAPSTLSGFLLMPIQMGSPVCQFTNFIQYELGKHYIGMWIAAGVSALAFIVGLKK